MRILFLLLAGASLSLNAIAQNEGHISGNIQANFQLYEPDSLIGAVDVPEKMLFNGFANVNYVKGDFKAGIRYESYQNVMLGIDPRYKGEGITYRYASYTDNGLDITVGNFYEQFGSGMIFRSYEAPALGYDNMMDGFKIGYKITNGIYIKGIIGRQRLYFEKGDGIVRGIDGEFSLNEVIPALANAKTKIILGASAVSKYEADNDPIYNYPENVMSGAGRIQLQRGGFMLNSEYMYKINDPSADNNDIYKPGHGLLVNASYAQKGFGVVLGAKRIDNLSFRSQRAAVNQDVMINYLPSLSKQHTYALAAFYPNATQPTGEMAIQGELFYKIKKKTMLGGKYGTNLSLNFSKSLDIDRMPLNDSTTVDESGTLGYTSSFFTSGKRDFYQDFNIEINRKINKKLRIIGTYMNLEYNKFLQGKNGMVLANIFILEAQYKIKSKRSIRTELQYMSTSKDMGSWSMALIEYTMAPHWFVAVQDQFNHGNTNKDLRIHYYTLSTGYTKGAHRIAVNYGKQRAGIFCVGGVCREVPASKGLSVSITSSF
ncbi:MAG: hypothetical protein ACI8ZO_000906 [Flavobacteriales bacterium]|jgi:hypothetical protein